MFLSSDGAGGLCRVLHGRDGLPGDLSVTGLARTVDLGQYRHLLDIAGGSGIYACALAAHYPALQATVLEKPPVDRIAAAAIANAA